jgi:MFS family permease
MKIKIPIFLSLITVLMQYYCYAIFGFSASMLAHKFFPSTEGNITKYLQFFSIFALAMLARPLGASILSQIGDKYGKTRSLTIAGIAASISNFAVAFIPSYEILGISAILALIFCRMLMLVSISGELDGIRLYLTERFPQKSYIVSGFISSSTQAGVLLAAILVYIASEYPNLYFWQTNFIIGGIFGFFVCIIRRRFCESKDFIDYHKSEEYQYFASMPINQIFFQYKTLIFSLIIINGVMGAGYHIHIIFLGVYFKDILQTKLEYNMFWYNILAVSVYLIASIFFGFMAEKYQNIKKLIFTSISFSIMIAIINGILLQINSKYLFITNLLAIFFIPAFSITIPIYVQKNILYGLRYRILSISHAIGSVLISASSPVICTFFYHNTSASNAPYIYFILLLLLLLIAFIKLEKYMGIIK